jgi:hypothetical protein
MYSIGLTLMLYAHAVCMYAQYCMHVQYRVYPTKHYLVLYIYTV